MKGRQSMSEIQQKVYNKLDEMGIQYEVTHHAAVYTIEEMENLNMENDSEIVKNLFLRDDKKKRYFLVVLSKDRKLNVKDLQKKLESRRLSFASENDLQKILGLTKGSVSPFGILNDTSSLVEVIVDNVLTKDQQIGVHPNENTATVWIRLVDLETVIKDNGNSITYIEFDN